ncbi:hypothetical protein NOR_04666 [Metarhizium rileyi]|uniref:Rhodopsin domain-containing protein n=1 Tax=Metarhizium rileyi (strain RCEF 4871) TaxID=1649241 RepID=A0A167E4K0_METRR|nr:hypothetical protein NOR_04666 [Metarhizium rileyi RCEF 4871]
MVNICAAYTVIGYVATQTVVFWACHPSSDAFDVSPWRRCAIDTRYLVVQAVFDISSDVALFSVIMPTLWRLELAWQDKVPLLLTFSMAIYLILCAITSNVFILFYPANECYHFWRMRQAAGGIYISNLPYVWSSVRNLLLFVRRKVVRQDIGLERLHETVGSGNSTMDEERSSISMERE